MQNDLIARIYPELGPDNTALNAIEDSFLSVKPRTQPSEVQGTSQCDRHQRGSTQPLQDELAVFDKLPCINVRLSQVPRSAQGIVFGVDLRSEVVIPSWHTSISFHHFSVTFAKERYLIVKDLGSTIGTEVSYGEQWQGQGKRRNFQWIIGGHKTVVDATILVAIHPFIKFRIVVEDYDLDSEPVRRGIDRFVHGTATTTDLFGELGLPSRPTTEAAHGLGIASSGPLHIRRKLGEGSFGTVHHHWNVSDASGYALKVPSGRYGALSSAWDNEIKVMRSLDHDHIVKLLDYNPSPHPALYLEYMEGGSLDDYNDITQGEAHDILIQCLDALTHLHGLDPPIVHRDIKPDNILVKYRQPGKVFVKFGDFGIAGCGSKLETRAGTPVYQAPEFFEPGRTTYGPSVDIWSLGVTASVLLYNLPPLRDFDPRDGEWWCLQVLLRLSDDFPETDFKRFLLKAMVVMEPLRRSLAPDCLMGAKSLPLPLQSSSLLMPHSDGFESSSLSSEESQCATVVAQRATMMRESSSGSVSLASLERQVELAFASASSQEAKDCSQVVEEPMSDEELMEDEGLSRATSQQRARNESRLRRSMSPERELEDDRDRHQKYRSRTPVNFPGEGENKDTHRGGKTAVSKRLRR